MAEHPSARGVKKESLSKERRDQRKQRLLKHGATALVRSIADAVVLKNEDLFLLTDPDGNIPFEEDHGLGLYYHDCRFLNGYVLKLGDVPAEVLASDASLSFKAVLDLTNQDIQSPDGRLIRKELIGVKWVRTIDSAKGVLYDLLTFQNFSLKEIDFAVSLSFRSAFEDIFEVRGAAAERRGRSHPPSWEKGALSFVYDGADGLYRSLSVYFNPTPHRVEDTTVHYRLALEPRQSREVLISLVVGESPRRADVQPASHPTPDLKSMEVLLRQSSDEWLGNQTGVETDSLVVNQVMDRSLRDLRVLRSQQGREEFFAAGVPWFATLFGRDSLITALQTLTYDPGIAAQTLRLLASYQGKKVDDWRDEAPGKILHELRVGEMARLGEVPQTPYYGSIDATPLFLILVAQHAACTGDLTLFQELKGNVERALEWLRTYADPDGDGYVEYECKSRHGLNNQGWKDSGDSIVNADGTTAEPPIGLVEVQGYAYMARLGLADLYQRVGEVETAERLRKEAEGLKARFNRDFWLEKEQFYALALQKGGKPAAVVASNPGQALWTGIVDAEKAKLTAERLMARDMFSGWGIRTLSEKELRYSPIGYHLGTVWPHDNSIIAAGLKRYGFEEAVGRIFAGTVQAAMGFPFYRLPELFAGFGREDYSIPVRYPVACHPQAWAAGTVPFLLVTLLGLTPEAFDHRLRIVRPILPEMVDRVQIRRLRVGPARADLAFARTRDRAIAVDILNVEGPLDIVVEPGTTAAHSGEQSAATP